MGAAVPRLATGLRCRGFSSVSSVLGGEGWGEGVHQATPFSLAVAVGAVGAVMLLGAAASALAQPAPLVGADQALGAGWRVVGLPQQSKPLTRYTAASIDGRPAVRLEATASYGNLVFDLPGQPAPQRLRWSWRLERPNTAVDLTQKSGDDAAAKVCLSFDLPLDRVPFMERQLLRLARSKTGEALPAATLCWVWGHAEAHEALIANPYSRRLRVIVLRNRGDVSGASGPSGASVSSGRWFDEERDVAADWKRAFGEESAEVPPLLAAIVAADADNTGQSSLAYVAGLRFGP